MKIELLKKDIIYIDMDGVLVEKNDVNFKEERLKKGFFLDKKPILNAVESFQFLARNCEVYILSTPVWDNEFCWTEKRLWVDQYLGILARKKLILTHNKALNEGKLLIDDSLDHGVQNFKGTHLHFGSENFPDWETVLNQISFIN